MMMFARGGLLGDNSSNGENMAMQSLGSIQASLSAGEVQRNQLASEVSALATNLGFNKDFIYNAVMNNGNKIAEAVNAMQQAMCNDSHQTMLQLYGIGTQLQQGNASIINAVNQIGFGNERAVSQASAAAQATMTQLGFNNERGLWNVSNSMERGIAGLALNNEHQTNHIQSDLAGLGYATQQNYNDLKYTIAKEACETRQNSNSNKTEILNWLNQNRIDDLQDRLNVARTEITTQQQTDALKEAIWTAKYASSGTSGSPSAYYPNGSQAYPFWVNNTVQS